MSFSCSGCDLFRRRFVNAEPCQVVLVGVETHICVNQTAHDLLDLGHTVIVCADAVSARTEDRHTLGLGRLRDAGAIVAHSESVVYEWMRSADHEKFREVLKIVKSS
jgi:nicotinamidase-related amidase